MRESDVLPVMRPLLSWDIFMQGYRRAQLLADDRNALVRIAKTEQWQHDFNFEYQLFNLRNTIVVTNSLLNITFASSSLMTMSGYDPQEVIGKTPRIFQGKRTTAESKEIIRRAVEKNESFESTVVNYRKNGSLYTCHIKGYPMYNKEQRLMNYIAFEQELTDEEIS